MSKKIIATPDAPKAIGPYSQAVSLDGWLFASGQILALKLMSEMKSARMTSAKIVTALLGVAFNVYGASVAGLAGVVAALIAFSVVYLAWMIWLAQEAPRSRGQRVFMTPKLKAEE